MCATLGLAEAACAQTPSPVAAPRMKAIVYREFGGPEVLTLEEIDRPVPTDDQVLVRVRAASINPLDWHFMEGTPYVARLMAFGLLQPSVTRLGVDYAGTVESVGRNVTTLKPGDEVFGGKTGAFAEYVCVSPGGAVALKPAGVTFEAAASTPIAALTALQALRDDGKLQPGQKVLINGASGGVGTFAVQIAKSLGARVTGVCSSRNVDLVRSLGADHVVDYTKEDFTRSTERYDLIVDNVGNRRLSEYRRVLSPHGIYVLVGGGGANDHRWMGPFVRIMKMSALSPVVGQRMGMMLAKMSAKDLAAVGELIDSGKVTPVIDRRYTLSQLPDAIRYLETGRARGKVIISMDGDGDTASSGAQPATGSRTGLSPTLIALVLIAVIFGVPIVPVIAALVLNRRFKRRHPEKRPYRWGYYFAIVSFICGIGLGFMLESGVAAVVAFGVVYAALAWFFARRRPWAWVALTALSFNPILWLINYLYLRKRWAEA
jgi:NADPH:quinone reductase-like Zn-dependent oxidoreductase